MKPTVLYDNVPKWMVSRLIDSASKNHRKVTSVPIDANPDTYRILCEKPDESRR